MKRKPILAMFIGAFFAFLLPGSSQALELRAGEEVIVNETVQGDYYVTGGSVSVLGDIDGDLVVAGGNVTVEGSVSGDILLAGGDVTILGNVGDDVRAVGGSILLSGSVGDDLVIAGGSLETLSDVVVGGESLIAGGQVTLNGAFQSVRVGAGQLTMLGSVTERFIGYIDEFVLEGTLAGPVELEISNIEFGEEATIRSSVDYGAPEEFDFDPVVTEGQDVTYSERRSDLEEVREYDWKRAARLAQFGNEVYSVLVSVVTLVLLWWLFRKPLEGVIKEFDKDYLMKLLFGFLYVVTTPIALVLILLSFVGAPFTVLGFVLYVTSLLVVSPVFAYVLVRFLDVKRKWKLASWKLFGLMVLVLIGFSIVGFIPLVGQIAQVLVGFYTLGAIISAVASKK